MLKISVIYADGTSDSFWNVLALTLDRQKDAPADALEVLLPFEVAQEVARVYVSSEDEVIFEGIVDEQTVIHGDEVSTRIDARSMAALLIDNEACPEIFVNPPFSLIFNRYGKCCGLSDFAGEDRVLSGIFKVSKGDSCYKVIKEFCKRAFGGEPEVIGGVLYPVGKNNKKEVVFGDGGIPTAQIKTSYSRCRLVSAVNVKTDSDGAYSLVIPDNESIDAGVCRQRYMDASALSGNSLLDARDTIKRGRLKAFEVTAVINCRCEDMLGCDARVVHKGKEYSNLLVNSIRYTFRERKEQTVIIMRIREE